MIFSSAPSNHITVALLVVCFVVGCHSKPESLEVFPVRGHILVGGKVPEGAEIQLVPNAPLADPLHRAIEPYGIVQASGAFAIGTYAADDGAPLGDYRLLVKWPKITIEGGENIYGPDHLRGRYSNLETPVATVTVTNKENVIPDINIK